MKILYGQSLVDELNKYCSEMNKRLWIAVPYIGNRHAILKILGNKILLGEAFSIRLLTDVSDIRCIDLDTLSLFIEKGNVKSLLGLHAKIYLVDDKCIITSANLTQTAFTKRHEIGISFDISEHNTVVDIFEKWWELGSNVINIGDLNMLESSVAKSWEETSFAQFPTLYTLPTSINESPTILDRSDWQRLFKNRPSEVRDLFEVFDQKIREIGADINRHVTGANILYSTSINFLELSPRNNGISLLLRTRNGKMYDPLNLTSIVPKSYNWGNLTHRLSVTLPVDDLYLNAIFALIVQSYDASI